MTLAPDLYEARITFKNYIKCWNIEVFGINFWETAFFKFQKFQIKLSIIFVFFAEPYSAKLSLVSKSTKPPKPDSEWDLTIFLQRAAIIHNGIQNFHFVAIQIKEKVFLAISDRFEFYEGVVEGFELPLRGFGKTGDEIGRLSLGKNSTLNELNFRGRFKFHWFRVMQLKWTCLEMIFKFGNDFVIKFTVSERE